MTDTLNVGFACGLRLAAVPGRFVGFTARQPDGELPSEKGPIARIGCQWKREEDKGCRSGGYELVHIYVEPCCRERFHPACMHIKTFFPQPTAGTHDVQSISPRLVVAGRSKDSTVAPILPSMSPQITDNKATCQLTLGCVCIHSSSVVLQVEIVTVGSSHSLRYQISGLHDLPQTTM